MREQDTGSKHVLPRIPPSRPFADVQFPFRGAEQKEDAGKANEVSMTEDRHDAQSQLSSLINLLQSQENLSLTEIAKKLNINVDAQTSLLLNNLRDQLMCALSRIQKNQNFDQMDASNMLPNLLSTMQSVMFEHAAKNEPSTRNIFSRLPDFKPRDMGPADSHSIPSYGYQERQQQGSDYLPAPVQNLDKHAGVKAALAQLLTQQAVGVHMGSALFDSTATRLPHPHYSPVSSYTTRTSFQEKPPEPSFVKHMDESPYSSLSSHESFPGFSASHPAEAKPYPDEVRKGPMSQYSSSLRAGSRATSGPSHSQDVYAASASYDGRMGW